MAILELKKLGFKYELADKPCLKNINVKIEKGEFVGVLGQNGVGKTTLCNIIRGIIPDFIGGEMRGEVLLEGRALSTYSKGEISKKIGFVFQNPFVQISGIKKTVYEEIAYGLENLGVPREEMTERVDAVLEQLKITHLKDKDPYALSGGQSQRVALAAVLVMNPDIIVVDEPTSQLDPQGTEEVFEALAILKENRKTVILVEHKIDLLAKHADRILILHDNYLVRDGKTEEILTDREIEKFGVPLPSITRLAYNLIDSGLLKIEDIPITAEKGYEVFRKALS